MPADAADVVDLLAFSRASGIPSVFRGAGTSLNGRSQTTGILALHQLTGEPYVPVVTLAGELTRCGSDGLRGSCQSPWTDSSRAD